MARFARTLRRLAGRSAATDLGTCELGGDAMSKRSIFRMVPWVKRLRFLAFFFWAIGAKLACGADLPDAVAEALARNAESLNPLLIKYEVSKSTTLPGDELFRLIYGADWTVGDRSFLNKSSTQYRYQDGRSRVIHNYTFAKTEPIKGGKKNSSGSFPVKIVGSEPWISEVIFDGTKIYTGTRTEAVKAPVMLVEEPEEGKRSTLRRARASKKYPPTLLRYMGFSVPQRVEDFKAPRIRSLILDLAKSPDNKTTTSMVSHDGSEFLNVRISTPDSHFSFELDPALEYAVRREVLESKDGKVIYSATLTDFQQFAKTKAWLPRKCIVEFDQIDGNPPVPATPADRPFFTERYTVTQCTPDPLPDGELTAALDKLYNVPRAHISDATIPGAESHKGGQVNYTVPANPADLDRVIEKAKNRPDPGEIDQPGSFVGWFVGVNVVIALALLAWFLYRRNPAG
jgi:hypothetical protein